MRSYNFTRAAGTTIDTIYETNDIISFTHTSNDYGTPAVAGTPDDTATKHLVYSYFDNKPNLSVYDGVKAVATTPVNVNDSAEMQQTQIRIKSCIQQLRIH